MIPDRRLRFAAFGSGEAAVEAWRAWELASAETPQIDPAELRLLPAVYRTLREAGVSDEEIAPAVKQATRAFWIRTRLLLRQAAESVRLLEDRGIAPILLKGAALVASGIGDARSRPMSDFDLLVRPEEAIRAAECLLAAGWTADAPVDARAVAIRHAALFKRGDYGCDLHWWALWDVRDERFEARQRALAQQAELDGVAVRVPAPEHQLMLAIVHGTRAFDETTIRWIGDALAIVRMRAIDWPLFTAEVRGAGAAYPAGEALAYLAREFEAAIPEETIAVLCADRVSRARRRQYAPDPDAPRRDRSLSFLGSLLHLGRGRSPLWLLRNLQYVVGARSLSRLPFAMLKRLGRFIRRRV